MTSRLEELNARQCGVFNYDNVCVFDGRYDECVAFMRKPKNMRLVKAGLLDLHRIIKSEHGLIEVPPRSLMSFVL